ncbi:MAG: putative inner membrane protein [Syntrophorhabdus sp. PtaU1.Bin002]|nr:MAG: putative inner membrane protein [Syntrophorhabdus sp. PtaB.Bin006]OPY61230.1 MAG: putative inner membrane protein [Syntrophorhabdus sp. PtaU1.Bin002]
MSQEVQEPRGWSPYLAGALAGLLIVFSVWFTGKYVGASTTFVRAAGYIEKAVAPERVGAMEYFVKELPKIDWQFLFVIGIFFGSLIASTTSKSFRWQAVPTMWEGRFGPSRAKRAIAAFVGGAIAMFGARLADG